MHALESALARGIVGMEYGQMKAPELRPYNRGREAKDLKIFLFDMKHYFRVVRADFKKGNIIMCHLSGDDKV